MKDDGLSPLPGIKKLPSFGRLKMTRAIRGPGSGRRIGEIQNLTNDEESLLTRRLGGRPADAKLAKRIIRYKGVYPTASYPELVTFDWLDSQGVKFTFQAHLFGGRSTKGGLVPDFVVQHGGFAHVWQIQGVYWHSRLGNRTRDEISSIRYIGQEFGGNRISKVLNLWEDDIYQKRPQIFLWALSGIELSR